MSDVEISRKIDGILNSPSRRPDTNRELLEQLLADLTTHMRFLTGDAERDLDRIDAEFDVVLHSNAAIYVGSWNGIRRLLLGVEIRGDDAHLALRATKGDVDIFDIDWGQSGPRIGNAVLVGRLLHVGICSFRRSGLRRMTNDPYNDRLRQEYAKLGFIDGERLPLDDPESLAKALIAIRVRYRAFGLDLAAPPP